MEKNLIFRDAEDTDFIKLHRIHEKFYANEFPAPKFTEFYNVALIEKNGKIVSGGGLRPIAEFIAVTDKDFSVRDRVESLSFLLAQQIQVCNAMGYDSLHCFIQNDSWARTLMKSGFQPIKGTGLILIL